MVWLKSGSLSLETLLATKGASLMYLAGKFIRFYFFLWLLFRLEDQVTKVSGFTINQLIVFFLVFNIFDMFGQIFFRGVYWFRGKVLSGEFDFDLLKPINPLFQVLSQRTDFLDIPLFLIVAAMLAKYLSAANLLTWLLFAFISLASILLITAVHVGIAALGVLTTEVDHTMMIYRDLSNMGRVPVDIYTKFIRALLTFVFPIAVITTFPAKVLMNLLSWQYLLFSILVSLFLFLLSLKFWKYALTKYSSASS